MQLSCYLIKIAVSIKEAMSKFTLKKHNDHRFYVKTLYFLENNTDFNLLLKSGGYKISSTKSHGNSKNVCRHSKMPFHFLNCHSTISKC